MAGPTTSSDSGAVEMPPSDFWTPDQAIAAAARIPFEAVAVVGHDEAGGVHIRASRMDAGLMLLLAEQLRLTALGL